MRRENPNVNATVPYKVPSQRSDVKKKTAKRTQRTFNMPTIEQFFSTTFENQLQIFHKSETQLKIGDLILARMKGYDPWPARILGFKSNNKLIKCYFFGAHNTGDVGAKSAIPFDAAFETVRLVCLRNSNDFIKGIKEIEIESCVPEELSCLRDMFPLH